MISTNERSTPQSNIFRSGFNTGIRMAVRRLREFLEKKENDENSV